MNMTLFEDAIALIETGSMRAAAHRRNVTQPAFSRRIQSLEDWLGLKLVERYANKIEIKETLLNRQDAFRSILAKLAALKDEHPHPDHQVTIGTQHTLAASVFPEIYSKISTFEFVQKIKLRTRNQDEIISQFLKYEIDLAITYHSKDIPMPPFNDSVLQKVWRRDSLVPVVGGDLRFLLSDGREPSKEIGVLRYPRESEFGKILDASGVHMKSQNEDTTSLETAFAAGMIELIKLGAGLGWVPQSLARDNIKRGELVVLSQNYKRIPLDVVLTAHAENKIGKNVLKQLLKPVSG